MSGDTDLEIDTVKLPQERPPYPREDENELYNQLIEINEEFYTEELDVLKFLCYDILPGNSIFKYCLSPREHCTFTLRKHAHAKFSDFSLL